MTTTNTIMSATATSVASIFASMVFTLVAGIAIALPIHSYSPALADKVMPVVLPCLMLTSFFWVCRRLNPDLAKAWAKLTIILTVFVGGSLASEILAPSLHLAKFGQSMCIVVAGSIFFWCSIRGLFIVLRKVVRG